MSQRGVQWRNWRSPVKSIAMPRSSAAAITAALRGILPLMRDITARAHPELVAALMDDEPREDEYLIPVWRWDGVKEAAQTLVGVLQNLNIREQILGPFGPTLAAKSLHP